MDTPPKKNVLMISTDHWFGRLFGHRDHEIVMTPTLDQLARSGTVFDRAYSECPVCMPARRCMMTGATPKTAGDRQMFGRLRMPEELPTMAQTFRDNGYQAMAVGKMHVYPQRDRVGFDDVLLSEEGRVEHGVTDDYMAFLADQGYVGEYMGHGMSNNQYVTRPWHLPEHCHPTNWATREMCRLIRRRDPTRPGFWYLSYVHPHPPLTPLNDYLDMYRDIEIPDEPLADWAKDVAGLPHALRDNRVSFDDADNNPRQRALATRAFYALCTHIDHQLRLVIGTLREEGLLGDTLIMFTSDHGDQLGQHGLWAKRLFYERSANVPMLVVDPSGQRIGQNEVDHRLVGHRDMMPTALDYCGIQIPETVEGISMLSDESRAHFYGEWGENNPRMTRMVSNGRHKLIYYPVGNRFQLFDIDNDSNEQHDLVADAGSQAVLNDLKNILAGELYGGDEAWVQNGEWVGLPDQPFVRKPSNPYLGNQRGYHFPMPTLSKP